MLLLITVILLATMLSSCVQTPPVSGGTTASAGTTAGVATTAAVTTSAIPNFNPTGYPIVNEPVKFRMFNAIKSNGGPYSNDMSFFGAMKDLTNIDFEFANLSEAEYGTKLGLSLASGDFYDIYMGMAASGNTNIVNYGVVGGVFLDYSDMVDDYMPHLASWLDEYPAMLKYVTQINGGIYSFPRLLAGAGDTQVTLSVRLDRMNEAGVTKVPETIDEFYAMCKALQTANANDPEFNVFVARQNDMQTDKAFQKSLISAFGDYTTATWQDDGTGKVFYNGTSEQYRRYLEFARKLFEEKIIFNEVFTLDSATNTAMHKANKTALSLSYTMLGLDNFASGNMDFTLIGPLTSQYSSVKKIVDLPGIQDTTAVITTACEHPEALLRWIDVHYAKEDVIPGLNHLSPHMGIRGETWDYTDETKDYYEFLMPSDWTMSATEFIYHKCGHGGIYMADLKSVLVGSSPGLAVKVFDSRDKILPYQVPNFPNPNEYLRYTDEDFNEYTSLWTDLDTYIKQMHAKFITGEEPLSNFQNYVETLESMGLPRVIELVQVAYDRWNGK